MLNVKKLKELVDNSFAGNISYAAREIGLSKSCLSRLLKGQRDVGKKTLKTLNIYCVKNRLEIKDYIFLD